MVSLGSKSAHVDRATIKPEDRLFALKVTLLFLLERHQFGFANLVTIVSKELEKKESHTRNLLDGVLRRKTQRVVSDDEMLAIQRCARRIIEEKKLIVPYYVDRIVEVANVIPISRSKVPSFIDPLGLMASGHSSRAVETILRYFGGCWDLYRLGSASTPSVPLINRSFLNIKPKRVLDSSNKAIAEFSIRQSADNKIRKLDYIEQKVATVNGIVAHTEKYITLVGEKKTFVPDTMGNLALLTWPYPDINVREASNAHFYGVSVLPNSDGDEISAYFVAFFITGSETLDETKYGDLRTNKAKAVGTFHYDELMETLTQEERERIKILAEVSESHMVFSNNALA